MTAEARAMLERWLESGTDIERRHAEARLAGPKPPTLPAVIPDRPAPGTGVRLGGCCS